MEENCLFNRAAPLKEKFYGMPVIKLDNDIRLTSYSKSSRSY